MKNEKRDSETQREGSIAWPSFSLLLFLLKIWSLSKALIVPDGPTDEN